MTADKDDDVATVDDRPSSARRKHDTDPVPLADLADAPDVRYWSGVEIARGGMGRVVEATDTLLGRTVALKEALSSDPDTLRRFARETRITARLEHPSIVPVYDAGTTPERHAVLRDAQGHRPAARRARQGRAPTSARGSRCCRTSSPRRRRSRTRTSAA